MIQEDLQSLEGWTPWETEAWPVASLFSLTVGFDTSLGVSLSGSSGCFSVVVISEETDEVVVSRSN